MTFTLKSFKSHALLTLATASLAISLGMMGCAGSKSSSNDNYSSLGSGESAAPTISPSQQRVDEAKRSAEEAEQKAHDLRVEKAKAKSNGN